MIVEPVAKSRGNREDPCRLCGSIPVDGLTKTHIPMKKSGNNGQVRTLVTRRENETDPHLADFGRPSGGGGIWGWWLCGDCNKRTGRWDETYQSMWAHLLSRVHDPANSQANNYRSVVRLDAGAYARSIWAWAFALDASLRDELPDVATAVLSGESVDPPTSVIVGLALTRSLRQFTSTQRGAESVVFDLSNGTSTTSPMPRAVIAAPPFNVVVIDADHAVRVPHADIGPLLALKAGQEVALSVSLPIIEVHVPNRAHGPITFDQFAWTPIQPEGSPAA